MDNFRLEVGRNHGVEPKHIVGAIANEADMESKYIGQIDIQEDCTFIALPEGMPAEVFDHLKKIRVVGMPMRISKVNNGPKARKGKSFKKSPSRKPRKTEDDS